MVGTTLRLLLLGLVVIAVVVQLRLVRRFWAFLFMFIVLFPKIGLAAVPGNSTPLRVDDLVLGAVLGGWLLKQALTPRDEVVRSPITAFLVFYLACAAASTLLGIGALRVTTTTAAFHFLRLVEYALVYYYFFRRIEPDEYPEVKQVFRNTWLIVVLVWAAQHVIGSKVPNPTAMLDASSYFPSFSASYDFGGYAMISTIVCYAWWTDRRTRDWATTFGLLIGLYVVFNADSRASFLGLAAGILFDLFLRLRVKVALGLVALASALPYLINSQKMARLFEVVGQAAATVDVEPIRRAFFNDPSIGIRLRNWQIALERWRESPLLGDGLGAYLQYVRIYDLQGTPDGWYIRMLAEVGLLGLLAFTMLLGCLLWTLLRAYLEFDRPLARAMVYAAALALVATATNALLIDAFVSYKIMGAFWMVMAAGTRLAANASAATVGRVDTKGLLGTGLGPEPAPGATI